MAWLCYGGGVTEMVKNKCRIWIVLDTSERHFKENILIQSQRSHYYLANLFHSSYLNQQPFQSFIFLNSLSHPISQTTCLVTEDCQVSPLRNSFFFPLKYIFINTHRFFLFNILFMKIYFKFWMIWTFQKDKIHQNLPHGGSLSR